jgi:hypothetical protein
MAKRRFEVLQQFISMMFAYMNFYTQAFETFRDIEPFLRALMEEVSIFRRCPPPLTPPPTDPPPTSIVIEDDDECMSLLLTYFKRWSYHRAQQMREDTL